MNCTVVLLKAFSGTSSGPRKYGFGVKTGVLDHAVTAFLLRLMQSVEMWRNCVVGAQNGVWEHAATALLLQTRQGRNC